MSAPAALVPAQHAPTSPDTDRHMTRTPANQPRITLPIVSVAVVVVVVGALIWFFGGTSPDTVDVSTALDTPAGATEPSAAQATSGDVDAQGLWVVDTAVREFSFEDSTGTFVGFRIDEELSGVGATEAVGRIPTVTGELVVEGSTITAATFDADATTLTTDDGRRDRRARAAMGAEAHPTISFVLAAPVELGEEPVPGTTYEVTASGALTVNGVSDDVEVPLQAQLDDSGVLVVTGSFEVLLSDHDVTAPSAPIVVSVSDRATVELQLLLTKG